MQFPGNKRVERRIQDYILPLSLSPLLVSTLLYTAQVRLHCNIAARKCVLCLSVSLSLHPSFLFSLIHLGTFYSLSLSLSFLVLAESRVVLHTLAWVA